MWLLPLVLSHDDTVIVNLGRSQESVHYKVHIKNLLTNVSSNEFVMVLKHILYVVFIETCKF